MDKSNTDLAQYHIARHSTLKGERGVWDTLWQDIADLVMPRKAEILTRQSAPGTERTSQIYDNTAIYANQTLANGQLSYMTPADSRWFVFDPPRSIKGIDQVDQWYQKCTEITQVILATSNFYSAIHELFFDDGAFGTSVILAQEGKRSPINFRTLNIGTYCIVEDSEGYIDTLYYERQLTCRQAEQEYGLENLSPKLRKEVEEAKVKGAYPDKKHDFIIAICPRMDSERQYGKKDGENKPIASLHIEVEAKHVCRNSGFDEQPFCATRHLKWNSEVYGWCPSWVALPEARQLNFLTKQLDVLAEIKAFPRMLVPDDLEGEIDIRANGITYYKVGQDNAIPREWMTQGDYAIGLDREKRKQENIEKAYHVDLFRMFASLDKQMTAREVAERSSEKLIQFTPAFARKTTELLNPLLRRVFSLLARQGLFPPPPREAMIQGGDGGWFLDEPDITYTSRIALAIKAMHNASWIRTLETIVPLIPIRPDILDNYDIDKISRDGARNDGLPADWITPEEKRDEIRQSRAEAAAKQAEIEQAAMMADAAGKAGNVKPDSVLGQALQQ